MKTSAGEVEIGKAVFPNDDSLLKMLYLPKWILPENGPADAVNGAKFIRNWKFSLRTGYRSSRKPVACQGYMNGCRKQPLLTCPAISANMQLRTDKPLLDFPPPITILYFMPFSVFTQIMKKNRFTCSVNRLYYNRLLRCPKFFCASKRHKISTAAPFFCSLFPPPAAVAKKLTNSSHAQLESN